MRAAPERPARIVFLDRNTLTDDSAALAASHGSALFDLTVAVRSSPALAALRPQV